jgi:hypothetical protein
VLGCLMSQHQRVSRHQKLIVGVRAPGLSSIALLSRCWNVSPLGCLVWRDGACHGEGSECPAEEWAACNEE